MYSHLSNKNFFGLSTTTIFYLIILLTFGRLTTMNNIIILLISMIIILFGLNNIRRTRPSNILVFFVLITLYNLFLSIIFPSANTLYFMLVQFISFGFITILSQGLIEDEYLNKVTSIFWRFYIAFSLVFFIAFLSGRVQMTNDSFMAGIYQAIFALSYFILLKSKHPFLVTPWIISIPFLSGERGLAISLLIVVLVYYLLKLLVKHKWLYKFFFWIVAACAVSYQYFYVWLSTTNIGRLINSYTIQYTEQNFFSGREMIWKIANSEILNSPIIGFGLDNNVLASNFIFMSAHNTYVTLLLNGGIISLLLYLFFIYAIWVRFFKHLAHKAVRLSASFLISIIIFGCNGVIIIENDVNFSLFLWLIIGIGYMVSNTKSKYENQTGKMVVDEWKNKNKHNCTSL